MLFGIQEGLVSRRRHLFHLLRSFLTASFYTPLGVLRSNRELQGYLISPFCRQFPDRYKAELSDLFQLAVDGLIVPHIDAVMPMSQAAEAHRRINASN